MLDETAYNFYASTRRNKREISSENQCVDGDGETETNAYAYHHNARSSFEPAPTSPAWRETFYRLASYIHAIIRRYRTHLR